MGRMALGLFAGSCRGRWCSGHHPHGQACIVIPMAALQYQHQVAGQVCMHASRPLHCRSGRAFAAQVSALQAQPPVVAVRDPVHQTVGQALGILGRCTRWQNRACRAMRVSISCPFMALLCGHAQRSGSVVGAFAAGVSGFATAPSIFEYALGGGLRNLQNPCGCLGWVS